MAHILSVDCLYSPSVDHRRGPLCHLRFAKRTVSVKNLSASGFYGSNVYWYCLATLQKSTVSDDSVVHVLADLHAHGGFLGLPALFQSCNPSFNLDTLGQSTKPCAYTVLHLKALQDPHLFHMVTISWPKIHTRDRKT